MKSPTFLREWILQRGMGDPVRSFRLCQRFPLIGSDFFDNLQLWLTAFQFTKCFCFAAEHKNVNKMINTLQNVDC